MKPRSTTILALETSSRAAGCALLRDGALVGESFLNAGRTHSQTILPMVDAMLRSAGASMEEVDLFAVTTGPGSFTGLRIGIAAVKGMALGADRPCVGVSTLEALAMNLLPFSGVVAPVMDARREQVYTALFRSGGGGTVRMTEDEALSVPALRERIRQTGEPVMLVGDGAALCMEALGDLSHVSAAPETLLHQRAGAVALAAARAHARGETVSAGDLAPAYLRLPQAERERMARLERKK